LVDIPFLGLTPQANNLSRALSLSLTPAAILNLPLNSRFHTAFSAALSDDLSEPHKSEYEK